MWSDHVSAGVGWRCWNNDGFRSRGDGMMSSRVGFARELCPRVGALGIRRENGRTFRHFGLNLYAMRHGSRADTKWATLFTNLLFWLPRLSTGHRSQKSKGMDHRGLCWLSSKAILICAVHGELFWCSKRPLVEKSWSFFRFSIFKSQFGDERGGADE